MVVDSTLSQDKLADMKNTLFILLSCLLLLSSCKDAEHLKTPDPALMQSMNDAMDQSYRDAGLDPSTAHNRRHKNTAYQLALHVLDAPQGIDLIKTAAPSVGAQLQGRASQLVHRVQRQRPGFPIPAIIDQLITSSTLSTDQQYLLLACIVKLEADTDLAVEDKGLRR